MMLAELDPAADLARGSSVSGVGQRLRQTVCRAGNVLVGVDLHAIGDGHHPAPGKLVHRIVATELPKLAQGVGAQIGQALGRDPEPRPAQSGEQIAARRAAAPTRNPRGGGGTPRLACRDQRIQMPADPGRADPESLRHFGGGDRTPLEELLGHGRPRLLLVCAVWRVELRAGRVFHNTSVTQLPWRCPPGGPKHWATADARLG